LRFRQEIPLAEAEIAVVEEGLTAYEQLLAKLADVPTPEGPTPRQLGREHPGIELAGQAVNKNAVAVMPKNQ
jgi:hypothetical protein